MLDFPPRCGTWRGGHPPRQCLLDAGHGDTCLFSDEPPHEQLFLEAGPPAEFPDTFPESWLSNENWIDPK